MPSQFRLYFQAIALRKGLSFYLYSRVSDFITWYPTLLPEYTPDPPNLHLLDSHTFGEVTGLIHITAAQDGDVVGEQL